jgi:L-serine deaminase|tara:strand:+ start:210 stop:440 length:231 start_codon:yes stop_codon:yes gene_type:complete
MSQERYVKIENNPDMVKDVKTGAILNTNINALNAFRNKKKKDQMVVDHEEKIHSMQEDLSEIKNLLNQLITKEDND